MKHPLFPGTGSATSFFKEAWLNVTTLPTLFRVGAVHANGPVTLARYLRELFRHRLTGAGQAERTAVTEPDHVALIDDYGSLTYREVTKYARRLASGLQRMHLVTNKTTIGYLARNGRGIVVPIVAQGYIGWRMALLNAAAGHASIRRSLRKMGAEILICDPEFADALLGGGVHHDVRIILNDWGLAPEEIAAYRGRGLTLVSDVMARGLPFGEEDFPFSPKQSNLVIMSSGTTSDPKGIILPHPQTPRIGMTIAERIPFRKHQRVLFEAAMYHAWGWALIQLTFSVGGTIVCSRKFDAEEALDLMVKHNCDAFVGSPVHAQQLADTLDAKPRELPQLEFIATSGNGWPPSLLRRIHDYFGDVVYNFYGSTELTQVAVARGSEILESPSLAGTIVGGTLVKIYDDELNELPPNEIGTVFAMCMMAMRGFATGDGSIERAHGMLSMGDRGFLDDQGRLHVLGRDDSMIIHGGENIHLLAVENSILELPGVHDAYVNADRSDPLTVTPVAWIEREKNRKGDELTELKVKEWVAENMISVAAPSEVMFVDELPYNPTGKVVPRRLPDWERFQPKTEEAKNFKPNMK